MKKTLLNTSRKKIVYFYNMNKANLPLFQEKLNKAIDKNIEFLSADAKKLQNYLDNKTSKKLESKKYYSGSVPFTV